MEIAEHYLVLYQLLNMRTRNTHHSPLRGFTLIEIVIGLVLLGILGVVGAKMIGGSVFTNQVISNEQMAYSSARYALERMSRDIREMQYNGSLTINTWTPTQLTFTKTGPQGTLSVTYKYYASGKLTMAYLGTLTDGTTYDGSEHDLVRNLSSTNGVFSYYQDIGANAANTHTAATATLLNYVLITLQVQPDPAVTQALSLSNLIYLHNR